MGHYEVLGVTPDDDDGDQEGVPAGRWHAHPDFHTESEVARLSAEDACARSTRMVGAGRCHQRLRMTGSAFGRSGQRSSGCPGRRLRGRPGLFDDSDDDEDPFDERDDRPITDSSLPRWFQLMPAALIVGGFVCWPSVHSSGPRSCDPRVIAMVFGVVVHDRSDHRRRHGGQARAPLLIASAPRAGFVPAHCAA